MVQGPMPLLIILPTPNSELNVRCKHLHILLPPSASEDNSFNHLLYSVIGNHFIINFKLEFSSDNVIYSRCDS